MSGERPWPAAYRRYRELERRFVAEQQTGGPLLTLIRNAAQGRRVFDDWLARYRAIRRGPNPGKLPEPPDDLLAELHALARLRSSYDHTVPGFLFEDVYHLAYHQLMSWRGLDREVPQASDSPRLYRGQMVDTWDVGASIYRGVPEGPSREPELRERAAAACRVGHAVAARLGLSFVDAMAVAQHYSAADILAARTWLVDLTRDPWVALFFASDGGRTGDVGIVWDIMPTEYASHTAGEGNPIGRLQLVVPPGISRIENQKGVFIVAGLPQIFEQYVAFGRDMRFHQHSGLTFEDPVLGIGASTIYPPDDPLRATLAGIRATVAPCGCGPAARPCAIPPTVFSDPLDPKTYEALLSAWLIEFHAGRGDRPEPAQVRAALPDLARFHASLHSPAYVGRLPSIVSRSLNRLRGAFENLYFQDRHGEPVSVRNAVKDSYVNQMGGSPEHVPVLLEALDAVAPYHRHPSPQART